MRKPGVGAAYCGNKIPRSIQEVVRGDTGCISMRGERASELARKTILSAFSQRDHRLSFIVHRRSAFRWGVWLHRSCFVVHNKAKGVLSTYFLRYLLPDNVDRYLSELGEQSTRFISLILLCGIINRVADFSCYASIFNSWTISGFDYVETII